jgi:hypothetical protein
MWSEDDTLPAAGHAGVHAASSPRHHHVTPASPDAQRDGLPQAAPRRDPEALAVLDEPGGHVQRLVNRHDPPIG